MLQLVEEELDKRFDELVEQGHLIYGPSTVTSIVDDGIPVKPLQSAFQRKYPNKHHSLNSVYVQHFGRSHNQKRKHPKNQSK